jgi:hypothetical protein
MAEFPALIIAGAISPPSRPITAEEDEAMVAQINASGAHTVWVGLKLPEAGKMDAGASRPGVEALSGHQYAIRHRRGSCCSGRDSEPVPAAGR